MERAGMLARRPSWMVGGGEWSGVVEVEAVGEVGVERWAKAAWARRGSLLEDDRRSECRRGRALASPTLSEGAPGLIPGL